MKKLLFTFIIAMSVNAFAVIIESTKTHQEEKCSFCDSLCAKPTLNPENLIAKLDRSMSVPHSDNEYGCVRKGDFSFDSQAIELPDRSCVIMTVQATYACRFDW